MVAKYAKGPLLGNRQCAITQRQDGDFLDFGQSLMDRRWRGQTYISVGFVEDALKAGKWLKPADADKLRAKVAHANEVLDELAELREYQATVHKALAKLLPAPEPEIVTQTVTKHRKPTEAEIRRFVEHPLTAKQEWDAVYHPADSEAHL